MPFIKLTYYLPQMQLQFVTSLLYRIPLHTLPRLKKIHTSRLYENCLPSTIKLNCFVFLASASAGPSPGLNICLGSWKRVPY